MIYIIGDSHVSVFSGVEKTPQGLRHIQPEFGTCYTLAQGKLRPIINNFEQKIPHFCAIKIGSNTAYNSFTKLPRIEQVISEYEIQKTDYIFLCFGEIDIRNHIIIQADKKHVSISECIKYCVDRYFDTVLYLQKKGWKMGVVSPPPSSKMNDSVSEKSNVILRNRMTLEFSEYLKNKCVESGIIFKEFSKKLMLPDGTTDQRFIMDDIHLSQKAMPFILEEFSDLI